MRKAFRLLAAFFVIALTFAVSANAGTLIVGAEDIGLPSGDKDYNDLVLSLKGNVTLVDIANNGGWQQMVTPDQNGKPFWDNLSGDGNQMNIGYFLTSLGAYASTGLGYQVTQLEYWGTNGGAADNGYYFQSSGSVAAEVVLEISAWNNSNTLFWIDPDNPLDGLHTLITGAMTTGAKISFSPGGDGDFALVLLSPSGAYSTLGNGNQFAVFSTSSVPEPASFGLIGLGLAGIGFVFRRKQ